MISKRIIYLSFISQTNLAILFCPVPCQTVTFHNPVSKQLVYWFRSPLPFLQSSLYQKIITPKITQAQKNISTKLFWRFLFYLSINRDELIQTNLSHSRVGEPQSYFVNKTDSLSRKFLVPSFGHFSCYVGTSTNRYYINSAGVKTYRRL